MNSFFHFNILTLFPLAKVDCMSLPMDAEEINWRDGGRAELNSQFFHLIDFLYWITGTVVGAMSHSHVRKSTLHLMIYLMSDNKDVQFALNVIAARLCQINFQIYEVHRSWLLRVTKMNGSEDGPKCDILNCAAKFITYWTYQNLNHLCEIYRGIT